jgi:triphosphoribosyl-dephospho-CoA synthase CitG
MEKIAAIGELAVRSLLYEAAATPKPGLVDRENNGAHEDMDFFTFLDSIAALRDSFAAFARVGAETADLPPGSAFRELRREGLSAERRMFAATGGVNTHKGAIFTLGLLCGAAARRFARFHAAGSDDVCAAAGELCRGICGETYGGLGGKTALTNGERVYLRYGLRGARGEAEDGFPSVRQISLPIYRELIERGIPRDDAMAHTLLHLIAAVDDTNVLARHNPETAAYARERAARALEANGMLTEPGRAAIREMDRDFIARRISPGGCADLLAATYFLASVEELLKDS